MVNSFIDHGYHQVTWSSKWFIEMLNQHSPVKVFWDGGWHGAERPDKEEFLDCDRIFVWQVEDIARELARIVPHKLVFIPMWNGASGLGDAYWRSLGQIRILFFLGPSSTTKKVEFK